MTEPLPYVTPLKSSTSCRVCHKWFEGAWSAANQWDRKEIERQINVGRCDDCTRKVAAIRDQCSHEWYLYMIYWPAGERTEVHRCASCREEEARLVDGLDPIRANLAVKEEALAALAKLYDALRIDLCRRCRDGICSAHQPSGAFLSSFTTELEEGSQES